MLIFIMRLIAVEQQHLKTYLLKARKSRIVLGRVREGFDVISES